MSELRNVVLVFVMLLAFISTVFAQTNTALHATAEEVDIWERRSVNGPYKEGWNAIKGRADKFVSYPESRWTGKTSNSCYNEDVDGSPGRARDAGLRDAGFAYLITGNTSYRSAARNALIAQTAISGTDFSKTSRWCNPGSDTFEVANWVRRLVYGYSYIRSALSSSDRTTLDKWFLNAGNFMEATVHYKIAIRFPNRLNGDYSRCSSSLCPGKVNGLLYYGGPEADEFSQVWANQPATKAAMFAAIGVVINNATLKDRARRFVQEWIKFAVWPNGVVFDQYRWKGTTPQIGYSYAGTAIGSIITIADHLARAGDSSLYKYSTSVGMFGTEGGPKSLLKVLQHFAGLTTGTIKQYASTTSTTDSSRLIDPFGSTENRINYIALATANIYYDRSDLETAYRTPLPSKFTGGGYDARGGDWGTYPDVLFMFGQQENAVNPYPD